MVVIGETCEGQGGRVTSGEGKAAKQQQQVRLGCS